MGINKTSSISMNKGFEIAKGDIFGYINSDDYLLKNTLKDVEDLFNKFSGYDVIYGNGFSWEAQHLSTKHPVELNYSEEERIEIHM